MTALIDIAATIHYPAGILFAAFAATIATLPIATRKARS